MVPTPHKLLGWSDSMAPVLRARDSEEALASLSPWVIVVIILGVVVLVTLVVFVIIYFIRRRRLAREDRDLLHVGSQRELRRKRTRMSVTDRAEAEEQERSMIIRKSLACRSSTLSTTSSRSWNPESARNSSILDDASMELADHEAEFEPVPQEDWKQWEARALANPTGLQDPALRGHPALQEMRTLPIPKQTRSPSPDGVVKGQRQMLPLPTLPASPPRTRTP